MPVSQVLQVLLEWLSLPTADQTNAAIAFVAVVLSIIALVNSHIQGKKAEHDQVLKALQGEKEAVAYIAYKLANGRMALPEKEKEQHDIIEGLCLAAIFSSADRTRVLVYEALRFLKDDKNGPTKKTEIEEVVQSINASFSNYKTLATHVDLETGFRRLGALMAVLEIKTAPSPPTSPPSPDPAEESTS
jgi:hypothetical protein